MNMLNVLSSFSRLCISNTRNITTNTSPLYFHATNALLGMPLKKKKRIDPAIVRMREERRKKKIEKQIRRLAKFTKQLKPIEELEVPVKLIKEREKRLRPAPELSAEELERRELLGKDWTRYKLKEFLHTVQLTDSMLYSQQKALDELRAESEELYNEAIQIDLTFTPYVAKGPVHTPPIKNYELPDGEYVDITKKFEGE